VRPPAIVLRIDAEAMDDGTRAIAEARMDPNQVGPFGLREHELDVRAGPERADRDALRAIGRGEVAHAEGNLDITLGGRTPAGSALVVAVEAGGRVIDRPQAVAAVAAWVVGQPPPGEQLGSEGPVVSGRGIRRARRRQSEYRPGLAEEY
jgi:hypothetical protein